MIKIFAHQNFSSSFSKCQNGSKIEPTTKKIPNGLSIYFDLIRFLAAVSVVLFHTWKDVFPDYPVSWPGHEAVVVFFVLSGYVITHAASRPGMTLAIYTQHRIARIVPVAWAALLLAFILSIAKDQYPVWPTLINAIFMGQSGFWAVEAPINPPFWSLSYEVWYYIIFAAWMYTPRRHRTFATIVAMLCAGLKILLLFPVWLMGVWLYRKMPKFGTATATLIFIATLTAAGSLYGFNVTNFLRDWLYTVFPPAWHFHYSSQFLYDTLLGAVVTFHFASVAVLGEKFNVLNGFEKLIRYLASFTFSLYVFHEPLRILIDRETNPFVFYTKLVLAVFVLANITEKRVDFFRKFLR